MALLVIGQIRICSGRLETEDGPGDGEVRISGLIGVFCPVAALRSAKAKQALGGALPF